MLVFMIRPIFEFTIEYNILKFTRWMHKKPKDQNSNHGYNKAYDYIEFLELHAGPEYNFYYKTANTTIMVFITLIFGPALPILYIISLIAIGSAYFIDRLALTYFYRLPPKYSDKLTLLNLKIMSFAPIISLTFTFWLYNNQQMFGNQIDPIKNQNDLILSHHTFSSLKWARFNSNEKLIIYSIFVFGIYLTTDNFYQTFLKRKEKKAFETDPKSTVPKYWSVLKTNECAQIVEDEQNFRKLGFKCMDNEQLEILKEIQEQREANSNTSLSHSLPEINMGKIAKDTEEMLAENSNKFIGQSSYQVT